MKRIVGIGACVLDTLIECSAFPAEDTKSRADQIVKTGGGPVANALVAASKLGLRTDYLGALPGNSDGDFLAADFQRHGVGTEGIRRVDATAFTSYVIINKAAGTRTCIADGGTVADDPRCIDDNMLHGADVLHVDGNYIKCAIKAARFAKDNGILVSYDAGSVYRNVEKLVPFADILIPSQEWALAFTGEKSAAEALLALQEQYHPKVLAITQGSQGGIYWENDSVRHYSGFEVPCVDSNGAGDTFHGAFLAFFLGGNSVAESCRFASAAAAIKCTKIGMRAAIPDTRQIFAFLQDRD